MARAPLIDPLITYGVGLTRTGNEVNLKPALYDPADLGGVYILPTTGIGITDDGGLAGIRATPDVQGMLLDAPYNGNSYIRKDGDWTEITPTDPANLPIATYTDLGVVYIVPDRALRIEADGALDVLPAAPDQLGVIFDPPFDSGNPDITYVRKWGNWVASPAAIDFGIGLSLDETATPPIVHLQPAGYTEPGDPAKFLGGVFVTPATGLGLVSSTGELSGQRATPQTIGMMFDAPFDTKAYYRSGGSWVETTRPETSTIPIAGFTPATLGAVYIAPDRALHVEADGALTAIPASPDQLGVIFDPPFDSGDPDKTYVRRWGYWIENKADQVYIAGDNPNRTGIVYVPDRYGLALAGDGRLTLAPATPSQYGGIYDAPFSDPTNPISYVRQNAVWVEATPSTPIAVVGRSPLNGIDYFYDANNNDIMTLFVPLATDFLAGSIVEPPADNQVYVRSFDGTKGTWVSSSTSAILIQDDPPDPLVTSPNSLWWDSNAGDLFVLYKDVDSTQWVQINTAVPANLLTEAPLDGNQYTRGSSAWNILTAAINQTGDVKTSLIAIDHNGWIKLDGRAITTLTASQQAEAASLGFTTNLPDATNAVMLQNGTALGTISGSWDITQANLPDIDLTAADAGDHQHFAHVYDGAINKNMYSLIDNNQPTVHWASSLMCATDTGAFVSGNETGNFMQNDGIHNHSIPLGGAGTPINPLHMSVNHFVFLGV